jgi:hypothetical protein
MPPCCWRPHLAHHQALAALVVIHSKIQARTEQVLVVLRVHARRHQRAIPGAWTLTLTQQVGGQLTRQLDLIGDGAILRGGGGGHSKCQVCGRV